MAKLLDCSRLEREDAIAYHESQKQYPPSTVYNYLLSGLKLAACCCSLILFVLGSNALFAISTDGSFNIEQCLYLDFCWHILSNFSRRERAIHIVFTEGS